MVGILGDAGVPVLAGTDLGVAHVIPGLSLHDEVALIAASGIGARRALRAATSGPARFLGLKDSGSLRVGQRPDIVLLGANPFENVSATQHISAVVLAGHLLRRTDLDRLLSEAGVRATGR